MSVHEKLRVGSAGQSVQKYFSCYSRSRACLHPPKQTLNLRPWLCCSEMFLKLGCKKKGPSIYYVNLVLEYWNNVTPLPNLFLDIFHHNITESFPELLHPQYALSNYDTAPTN